MNSATVRSAALWRISPTRRTGCQAIQRFPQLPADLQKYLGPRFPTPGILHDLAGTFVGGILPFEFGQQCQVFVVFHSFANQLQPYALDGNFGVAADPPGAVLDGKYRLVDRLGRGGFGDVWRAEAEESLEEVSDGHCCS